MSFILALLLFINISFADNNLHFNIIEDLYSSYSENYKTYREKNDKLNIINNLTDGIEKKDESNNSYDYNMVIKQIEKNKDLIKLSEIIIGDPSNKTFIGKVPSLKAVEKYPEYFDSEIMQKYNEWDDFKVDYSFFDKGAFSPGNVNSFVALYGVTYYVSGDNCSLSNYEYWYNTGDRINKTDQYNQQLSCYICWNAQSQLPEEYSNLNNTRSIKYDKENQLYLLLKEKIKPIENDILKLKNELYFSIPGLQNDINTINNILIGILDKFRFEMKTNIQNEIVSLRGLDDLINDYKNNLNETYDYYKNSDKKTEKDYYISRYTYLSNYHIDEKNLNDYNKVTESSKNLINDIFLNDGFHSSGISKYPISNQELFLIYWNNNKLDSTNLNYNIPNENQLPLADSFNINTCNENMDVLDLQILSVNEFKDMLSKISIKEYETLHKFEIVNNTLDTKKTNKDDSNYYGLIIGDLFLLNNNSNLEYYSLTVESEDSWGMMSYKYNLNKVVPDQLEHPSYINIRYKMRSK